MTSLWRKKKNCDNLAPNVVANVHHNEQKPDHLVNILNKLHDENVRLGLYEGVYDLSIKSEDLSIKREKAMRQVQRLGQEIEQEPVAWVDPATLHHLKIGLEGVHLVYETEMVNSLPLYDKPQFQNPKQCLERLIRIMGTFDLATGHANTFDELLDSLESELRDVLGHYREALAQPAVALEQDEVDIRSRLYQRIHELETQLAQPEQEPVAYLVLFEGAGKLLEFKKGNYIHGAKVEHIPLYTTPPQRKWVGLTPSEIDEIIEDAIDSMDGLLQTMDKLKEKNT